MLWRVCPLPLRVTTPSEAKRQGAKLILNASRYLQLNDNQKVREMITQISADHISILL